MKNLVIILITLHFSLFTLHCLAQSCLPEGITFDTQAQIDNFQTNYPGCTEIEGYVTIGDHPSYISNLIGLNVLTSIGGSLVIHFNDSLPGLIGLDNLVSIGADLEIWGNREITDLEGLGNLTSIGGEFIVIHNKSLTSLAGLGNIDPGSISNLEITDNKNLTNCEAQTVCAYLADPKGTVNICNNGIGCNNPAEASGACGITLPCLPYGNYYLLSQAEIDNFQVNYPGCTEIEGDVTIYGEGITNLDSLYGITSIAGSFTIGERYHYNGGNPDLENLSGLRNLTTIGHDLTIWQNPLLSDLAGLENLTHISGGLYIGDNPSLKSLDGLIKLELVGGDLSVWGPINSLFGLSNLISVGGCFSIDVDVTNLSELINLNYIGGLRIGSCGSLTSLTGLENITAIEGNVSINGCLFWFGAGNPNLTSLTGLNNLTSIGGNLEIMGNAALVDFTGLENLTSVKGSVRIGGDGDGGTICDNPSLSSFTGFNQLDSVGGSFTIHYNDTLLSLSGLDKLTEISGDLIIVENPTLNSLMGLKNLKSIGGELMIGGWHDDENSSLVSLDGLENIDPCSISELTITYNSLLSECDVQSICSYLASPDCIVEIHDNAPGCDSREEVDSACEHFSIAELRNKIRNEVYPNPFSISTAISYTLDMPSTVIIDIINPQGQLIEKIELEQSGGEQSVQWNAKGLPSGMYYFRLKAREQQTTGKLVVVR